MNLTRREMLRELLLAGLSVTAASAVLAGCGTNNTAPTTSTDTGTAPASSGSNTMASSGPIKLGFIPLTDCASLVVADQMGYFKKHGVDVTVVKMANWNAVRDQISGNQLQGAHCLFGMPFAVETGVSKVSGDPLRIAMMISQNGQGTSLSNDFEGKVKYADFAALGSAIKEMQKQGPLTFGMTFPGGTHDMWMHLSLAGAGIDPKSVAIKPIPPPQMVNNMKTGGLNGYNVGEPWNGRAVAEKVGFSFIASQDLWQNHPEKALVVNAKFAEERKDELKKVMMAMLEASKFIDEMKNRPAVAKTIGTKAYVGAEPEVILPRLMGDYPLGGGLGMHKTDHPMQFYRNGEVNFPRHGNAIWFMTAYERFGKAKLPADPMALAQKVILQDLYKEVATEMKLAVPDDDMKPFEVKVDKMTFDPNKPKEMLKMYAALEDSRRVGRLV